MKKLYAELDNKGSYITENWSKTQYEETLTISKDHFLIPLDYIDQNISKRTRLKLLVFQNQDLLNEFRIWFSNTIINGEKLSKMYHFFGQNHNVVNTNIALITLKTKYNYFMGENQNLIIAKLNTIARLLKSDCENEIEEIYKELNLR